MYKITDTNNDINYSSSQFGKAYLCQSKSSASRVSSPQEKIPATRSRFQKQLEISKLLSTNGYT